MKDQLYIIDSTFCAEPAKFEYTWLKTGELVKVETLENLENHHVCVVEQAQQPSEETSLEEAAQTPGTQVQPSSTASQPRAERTPRPRIHPLTEKRIQIRENQAGVTYKGLFGDYLRGAKKITLIDPYIRYGYQIDNFVDFVATVVEMNPNAEDLHLHLSTANDSDEKVAELNDIFADIEDELSPLGIEFTHDYLADHDRNIITDTGWNISLSRGLDIYEPVNRYSMSRSNQAVRRCKAFELHFDRIQNP